MTELLMPRQKQILQYITQHIQKKGYSPTLKEIAKAIGVNSVATVHEHIAPLLKQGILKRKTNQRRSLNVVDRDLLKNIQGVELSILGYIAAGQPLEPYTDPNATLNVSPQLISAKKRAFVLQVKGDSMVEEGILDGDFVVIEEQEEAKNGEIVVALLENGLATLKRFFKEATRIRLEPANSKMTPIFAKDVRIQGKVVAVIRKYTLS